jgi:hypothetical protein
MIAGMIRLLFALLVAPAAMPAGAQSIVALWDPAYVAVRPGASVQIMIVADIRRDYVVVANQARDAQLLPLTLRFPARRGVTVGAPRYPAAQDARVDADRRRVPAYAGTLRIAVPVTVSQQAPPGELTLHGELRYQACFAQRCTASRTLPVKLTLDVLPREG